MVRVRIPPFDKDIILVVLLGSTFDNVQRKEQFLACVNSIWSENSRLRQKRIEFVQAVDLDTAAVGEYSVSDVYQVCAEAQEQGWLRLVFLDDLSWRQGMGCPRFGEQFGLTCILTINRMDRDTAKQLESGHSDTNPSPSFEIRRGRLLSCLKLCDFQHSHGITRSTPPTFDFVHDKENSLKLIHQKSVLRDPHARPFTNKKIVFPPTSYIYKLLSRANPPLPFDVAVEISGQMRTDDSISSLTEAFDVVPKYDYDATVLDLVALVPMTDDKVLARQRDIDWFGLGDIGRPQVLLHRWKKDYPASRRDMSRIFEWYKSVRTPQHKSKNLHMICFVDKPLLGGTDVLFSEIIWGLSQGNHWPDIFRKGNLVRCFSKWSAMCEPSYKDTSIDVQYKVQEEEGNLEVLWQPFQSFPRTYEIWHRPNFGDTADWHTMLSWYFVFLLDDRANKDDLQEFKKELYAVEDQETDLHEIFYANAGTRLRYRDRYLGNVSGPKTFNIVRLPASQETKLRRMYDILKQSNQKALLFADKGCIRDKEIYWVCNENFDTADDLSMVWTRVPVIDAYFAMIRSQRGWDRGLTSWASLHRKRDVFEYDPKQGTSRELEWVDEEEDESEVDTTNPNQAGEDTVDSDSFEQDHSPSDEEELDEESNFDVETAEMSGSALQVLMAMMGPETGTLW